METSNFSAAGNTGDSSHLAQYQSRNRDDQQPEKQVRRVPLKLTNIRDDDSDRLMVIKEQLATAIEIVLTDSPALSDRGFRIIFDQPLHHLRFLGIGHCPGISREAMQETLDRCNQLCHLALRCDKRIPYHSIKWPTTLRDLRLFNIDANESGHMRKSMSGLPPGLKRLGLYNQDRRPAWIGWSNIPKELEFDSDDDLNFSWNWLGNNKWWNVLLRKPQKLGKVWEIAELHSIAAMSELESHKQLYAIVHNFGHSASFLDAAALH